MSHGHKDALRVFPMIPSASRIDVVEAVMARAEVAELEAARQDVALGGDWAELSARLRASCLLQALGMIGGMPRSRFPLRFSLRTLFMVVTVLCLPLGWLGYQLNWVRQRREALATRSILDITDSASLPAPSALSFFGERGYPSLLVMPAHPGGLWTHADEAELKRAEKLFPEASVDRLR